MVRGWPGIATLCLAQSSFTLHQFFGPWGMLNNQMEYHVSLFARDSTCCEPQRECRGLFTDPHIPPLPPYFVNPMGMRWQNRKRQKMQERPTTAAFMFKNSNTVQTKWGWSSHMWSHHWTSDNTCGTGHGRCDPFEFSVCSLWCVVHCESLNPLDEL